VTRIPPRPHPAPPIPLNVPDYSTPERIGLPGWRKWRRNRDALANTATPDDLIGMAADLRLACCDLLHLPGEDMHVIEWLQKQLLTVAQHLEAQAGAMLVEERIQ